MNERIRQLAAQAGLYVDLNGRPYPKSMSAEECIAAYQKFAELIVQECAQEFDNTYMRGGQTIGAYLREKFGVKE